MVGVPGKYKGCETCRRRRVKCSNERPFCRNCMNSGRTCEGYERHRVFITGTLETKGRVASHPKKNSPGPSASAIHKSKPKAEERKKVIKQVQPPTSAWDDFINLSADGADSPVLMTALQTNLSGVTKQDYSQTGEFILDLPPYVPTDLHSFLDVDPDTQSTCMVRIGSSDAGSSSSDGYCVYLYDQNSPTPPLDPEMWHDTSEQINAVKNREPGQFSSFPNHQFFVRVYRPLAASLALLHRRESHLSSPDWMSRPWESHPKSQLDQLLDLALRLPAVFEKVDSLLASAATTTRRLELQEILSNCLVLEGQFSRWLAGTALGSADPRPAFWVDNLEGMTGDIPFEHPFTFRDSQTGLTMVYYWMCQLLFHRSIEAVHAAVFQPVIDAYPDVWMGLPTSLQIDISLYQDSHELAANICRGLDAVLTATVQPDMLVAPMTVVGDFYHELNTISQDGVLEMMWLDSFKGRLFAKGQHVTNILQEQQWTNIAMF
ncbi:hypothetical protein QQS21_004960 [Conoideocrella luteorostrata]|uniref:Zn(2)-C6 fungal-type domain-containing protein n=1 Tax=Conoideocrella luteorostrata TaxID=1105319 RepID=A0AAJ0CRE4_9HYPO|nr:hypothetical protein QQS21_004960 [Conoideocrella luteorostrata]